MTGQKSTHVSEAKKKIVAELVKWIENKRTILFASIKNLPASQFQEIGKKLRGKAVVKVPKKNLILRALENSKNEEAKKLEEFVQEDTAILFSELDSFDLAGELIKNKSPTGAKIGQEAPIDIEVPAGPTDLVPGPAISELGALGIQIQIKDGKIEIKQPKVIVKKGQKISEAAVGIMNKLGIKPFTVGFVPLAALDSSEKKIYREIRIDREGTLNELKVSYAKALSFAVNLGYACEDTIKNLIMKAERNAKALEAVSGKNTQAPEQTNGGGN